MILKLLLSKYERITDQVSYMHHRSSNRKDNIQATSWLQQLCEFKKKTLLNKVEHSNRWLLTQYGQGFAQY